MGTAEPAPVEGLARIRAASVRAARPAGPPGAGKDYRVVLYEDEGGGVVARCADIKGITSDGADESEALLNVTEAIEAYLEAADPSKISGTRQGSG